MTGAMDFADKIHLLKSHEEDCYRICHHILQQEELAHEAVKRTLRELFLDDGFFRADLAERKLQLRKETVKASLQIYKQAFAGAYFAVSG